MDRETLRHELKQLIVRELDLRHRTAEQIADDEPLFGQGLGLDSLDALQLAMAVDEHFGVKLPDGEEARAIFASVSTLADHIAKASAA